MPSSRRSVERDRRLPVAPLVIILIVLIVVTGFIGAPIFLYLLGRSQYRFSSES